MQERKRPKRSEAKRLLYVAVTRAENEVYWCARTSSDKESWWAWLEPHLASIDQKLFRVIPADLVLSAAQPPQATTDRLKLPVYAPLKPQYSQVVFSVTELMNYDRCPHYYYLRHILGLPERPREAKGASGSTEGSLLPSGQHRAPGS